ATGGGTLGGTLTATTNASGVATFTDLSISGTAGGRTLDFSASGLTAVSSGTVTVTAATQLALMTQPSASTANGVAFAQQPVVQLRDASNNAISQAGVVVTAAIAAGGGTLGGTLTVTTNGSGVATFTDLSISGTTGDRTLQFSASGLTAVTSGTVTLAVGAATQLVLTTQPSGNASSATAFVQQPVVQLRDSGGNNVSQASVVVTAAIATGGGTLGGTLTATTNGSGVATFTNLSITGTIGDRTLQFSASGLTAATSTTITLTAATLPPTLTTLSVLGTVIEDSSFSITFDGLRTRSNAADSDGTVVGFVVKTVSGNGTLRIGGTAFNATSNKLINASKSAVWTPASGTLGEAVNAFTVVALDNSGAESASPVQARVSVDPVSESPSSPPPTVIIPGGGVVNGGQLSGRIQNSGTITNVLLESGTRITGGSLGGTITGNPKSPARINNGAIVSGARLENVVIGAGTSIASGVQLGPNVKFTADATIPPGLDFTNALPTLQWAVGDQRTVVDLADDVSLAPGPDGGAPLTIMRAIQMLEGFEPAGNTIEQDSASGEVLFALGNGVRGSLLPVGVGQVATDDEPGTFINEDGDIVFITANRRQILSRPVLVEKSVLDDVLEALGWQLEFNERTDMRAQPRQNSGQTASLLDARNGVPTVSAQTPGFYFSARPEAVALPAFRDTQPGLVKFLRPELPITGIGGLSVIFADADGRLLEQDIVPVPADWLLLKAAIKDFPGVSDVRIDTAGVISVMVQGVLLQGMVDYKVFKNGALPGKALILQKTGDLAGGVIGYEIRYPNGDHQKLFVFRVQRLTDLPSLIKSGSGHS
ncbi:MAG: hypothetical protein RQ899_11030, partial [Pseudomonadales bacterium]|nr:hypothetical protein [Pseudomonadales bacterium]